MMEPEDRERLIRIDERGEQMMDAFKKHMEEDRADFKEIHSRINSLAARQNWLIGIGTGAGTIAGAIMGWLKSGGGPT